jgi:hypothetical protein
LRKKGGLLGLAVAGKGSHRLCLVQVVEKVDTRRVVEEEESLAGSLCIVVICLMMSFGRPLRGHHHHRPIKLNYRREDQPIKILFQLLGSLLLKIHFLFSFNFRVFLYLCLIMLLIRNFSFMEMKEERGALSFLSFFLSFLY